MEKQKIDLKWHQLFSYRDIGTYTEMPNSCCVYIWLIRVDDEYYPYYVGKTNNITNRLFQHLSNLMGGTYNIYENYKFSEFHLYKDSPLYCQIPKSRIIEFIQDYIDGSGNCYHIHLKEMLSNSFFYICANIGRRRIQ